MRGKGGRGMEVLSPWEMRVVVAVLSAALAVAGEGPGVGGLRSVGCGMGGSFGGACFPGSPAGSRSDSACGFGSATAFGFGSGIWSSGGLPTIGRVVSLAVAEGSSTGGIIFPLPSASVCLSVILLELLGIAG